MVIKGLKLFSIIAVVIFITFAALEFDAHARAGGGRSMGGRGLRSYSQPSQPRKQFTPPPSQQPLSRPMPYQQPAGGGFMRSFGGAMLGGLVGGMLFRSLGFGGGGGWGGGGMGGSGIGLFEIILIAGIGYMIYRMVKSNRESNAAYGSSYEQGSYQSGNYSIPSQPYQTETDDLAKGLAYIRQMDPYFDENRFNDNVMDIFFKIQGAWMNRDLTPVSGLLTDEMRRVFQGDMDNLIREKRVNRLENIAVRSVEIAEAWQEAGQDYITALTYANLLDYTTDDVTGQVVSGSKTEPVKFEEYWTFTRSVGNNPWRLSGINQK